MSMTVEEAIKQARDYIKYLNYSGWEKDFDAIQKLIVTTEEVQQYRAIGTVSEFRELKEKKYECTIKHLTGECSYAETGCSDCVGRLKIKDALEKATAKKPKKIKRHRGGFEMEHCPNCDTDYQADRRFEVEEDYCGNCGKLLDSSFINFCANCGCPVDMFKGKE